MYAQIAVLAGDADSSLVVIGAIAFLVLVVAILRAFAGGERRDTPPAHDSAPLGSVGFSVPPHFVVFDLETTGLNSSRHEIIEIGAIRVNRDSDVHDTFQALVKPTKRIRKNVTRINGISQEMVDREGEPLDVALKAFVEFIGDLPLVSFNAEFDMAFLSKAAEKHDTVIRNKVTCALKMARRAWPGRASYRLCDLARDGNLSDEDTHRALGDCKRTIFVYAGAAAKLSLRKKKRV
jgi:DNA polymerase III epsilon subunit family exonuclease